MSFWILFFTTFILMEFAAWSLHKYVMHGFLWCLHKDHHVVNKERWWQWNDFFAIFFAVPSFLFILYDALYDHPHFAAVGFGIMAYGAAYFFVHEVVIHKRLRIKNFKNKYILGLKKAHHVHHAVKEKHGASSFGMLIVSPKYFK